MTRIEHPTYTSMAGGGGDKEQGHPLPLKATPSVAPVSQASRSAGPVSCGQPSLRKRQFSPEAQCRTQRKRLPTKAVTHVPGADGTYALRWRIARESVKLLGHGLGGHNTPQTMQNWGSISSTFLHQLWIPSGAATTASIEVLNNHTHARPYMAVPTRKPCWLQHEALSARSPDRSGRQLRPGDLSLHNLPACLRRL